MYRHSKYGNIKTEYNGRKFDSKSEANHAIVLDTMKRAKIPSQRVLDVQYQYKFPVTVSEKHICNYIADFYVTFADGHTEIQDVKGMRTPVYKLKKKLVEALYGQPIIEF